MKALIVEDERMARQQLARLVESSVSDVEVAGMTDSIQTTVAWLKSNPEPDIIFMDVELLDGDCFEIFRQVQLNSKVIMTTAYDNYAIKAFESGSIDYLLKPVDVSALQRAVSRCRQKGNSDDALRIMQLKPQYKEKSTVRSGDKIIPLKTDDIAYYFSEYKANYLMTFKGEKYIIDSTMEQLESELNPEKFFRISRGCIISINAISSVTNSGGKLIVSANPPAPMELTVSRGRTDDFLAWLG